MGNSGIAVLNQNIKALVIILIILSAMCEAMNVPYYRQHTGEYKVLLIHYYYLLLQLINGHYNYKRMINRSLAFESVHILICSSDF